MEDIVTRAKRRAELFGIRCSEQLAVAKVVLSGKKGKWSADFSGRNEFVIKALRKSLAC
ncbi:MAG: hypothetical protein AAB403_05305 [Planctomycetota bacterium]